MNRLFDPPAPARAGCNVMPAVRRQRLCRREPQACANRADIGAEIAEPFVKFRIPFRDIVFAVCHIMLLRAS